MANFDQRNQEVNTQFNVNIQSPLKPDATTLLKSGIRLLTVGAYPQAIDSLNEAIKINPYESNAYYYLALALLKGRRPKGLSGREVEQVDQLLNTATLIDQSNALFRWFRALVRADYYECNSMRCPPPSVEDIVEGAQSCEALDLEQFRTLLKELPMRNNWLYVELVKALT